MTLRHTFTSDSIESRIEQAVRKEDILYIIVKQSVRLRRGEWDLIKYRKQDQRRDDTSLENRLLRRVYGTRDIRTW